MTIQGNITIEEEPDWEFLDFAWKVEKEWREELRISLPKTTAGWLEVFPEAKKIIPEKIKEWRQRAETLRALVGEAVRLIESKAKKENQWFWFEVLKYTFPPIQELVKAKEHIKRLEWSIRKKKKSKVGVSEGETTIAKEQDLVQVVESYGLHPKKSGRTYCILCPAHNERTPSFHIYPPARYYCFGCHIKGDQISFVQMMEKCSFVDAVRKLQTV
jgi:hypothetical protein